MALYIDSEVVSKDEVDAKAEHTYVPMLKVLSYSISENHDEITLYTHAPVDMLAIVNIAEKFEIPYQDETIFELTATIDKINAVFQNKISGKDVHTLHGVNTVDDYAKTVVEDPLMAFIWNRDQEGLERSDGHNGYKVNYVHGHNFNEVKESPHIYNLDNSLGKTFLLNEGKYTAVYDSTPMLTIGSSPEGDEELDEGCSFFIR